MLSEFLLYLVGILAIVGAFFCSSGSLLVRTPQLAPGMPAWTAHSTLSGCGGSGTPPERSACCTEVGAGLFRCWRRSAAGRGNFGTQANSSSRSPALWGRLMAHLSSSTGTSGRSVTEPAPAWAAYSSRCARASHCRPSRCGHGAASTSFSTAIIGSQQPGPWVATTSVLMSLRWLSCLTTALKGLGVDGRTAAEPCPNRAGA